MKRSQVSENLKHKMAFLGGPRQIGKTTLIRSLRPPKRTGYLNWDIPRDREAILWRALPDSPLLVFDELQLRYFRDVAGREADFILVERRQPIMLVKCKLASSAPTPALRYLKERFPHARAVQVVRDDIPATIHRGEIEVCAARRFFREFIKDPYSVVVKLIFKVIAVRWCSP